MTIQISARPDPPPHWLQGSSAETTVSGAGSAADRAYLAVVVPAAPESVRPVFDELRAELKLAESTRGLPLAWPLPEWLGDYRDLLLAALGGLKATPRRAPQAASRTGEIREFLELLLTGRDGSAAQLMRRLTRQCPFAQEMRRLRRVQALFALIRPAHSLAEAFEVRILTRQAGSSRDTATP
jgi:hypothetical protein